MAIFTDSSSPAVGLALQIAGLQIAWGRGDADWDDTPVSPPGTATALVDEIGRRQANNILFVTPNPTGELLVDGVRYAQSATPTRYIYVQATFDNADGVGETIREAAVFVGTAIKNTVPPGTFYFSPSQLQATGQMLLLERFLAITRTVDFRTTLEFVLTL